MYSEYQFEKQSIEYNLAAYQAIFGKAIATALWNLDQEQLVATLNGANALKDIAGILLHDSTGETIYQSGKAPLTAEENTYARNSAKDLFYKSFKISHRSKHIGSLYLYSSNAIVFDKVKYNFLFILINAIIKSVALWFVFLWAFKRYLVGALERFTAEIRKTDLKSLDEADDFQEHGYLRDSQELSQLYVVFSSLKQRLRQSRQDLENINADLESAVDKRTDLLRRQQSLMESMSQQAHIGAWEYNVEKETTFWSTMTRDIFDVSSDFTPSQSNTLQFFDEENAAKLKELEARAISRGIPWDVDLQITTAAGKRIWIASTGAAEIRDGRCIRLFGSYQDIDQQVHTHERLLEALESAKAAAKTKDEFLARISHEIRTPMNGIIGMLSVLLNTELSPEQKKQATISLRSAESLLALLDDLIDISRIESGNFELHYHDFDLYQLLHDQLALWRPRASERELELDLDTSQLDVPQLNGDPQRIQQVLANLINNAIKFSEHGTIELKASSSLQDQDYLICLEIKDEGVGIAEDMIEEIFGSFVQEDNSRTRKFSGAGLGLAIVKELVTLMDGRVWVQSVPEKGSQFFVEFKARAAQNSPPRDESSSETQPDESEDQSPTRLLIVEDNPVNQMVAKAMLEQLGMHCELAEDGVIALDKLKAQPDHFALILMDCQMPNLDGYATTKAIRQGEAGEGYCPIPIVAMTANAMTGDKEKCLKCGMDDYISKPVTPDMLDDVISRWIKRN